MKIRELSSLLEKDINIMADSEKGEKTTEKEMEATGVDMMYKLEDTPPWYLSFLLGFQVSMSICNISPKT